MMSTPTTATATHPHYHYGGPFSLSHPHPHPQPYQAAPSSSYQILPAASAAARLAPYQQQHQIYSTSASSGSTLSSNHAGSNGINLNSSPSSSSASSRHQLQDTQSSNLNPSSSSSLGSQSNQGNYTTSSTSTITTGTMPTAATASRTQVMDQTAATTRKRRRSRGPDWHTFYKNGLPKEVIVIDDSPEPEANTSQTTQNTVASSRTMTNGAVSNGYHIDGVSTTTDAAANGRHLAKRRKRDGETSTHYDPVHNTVVRSHTNTPATSGGSTISSDRTNSGIHTTAETSLGSSSAGGHYQEAQPGQKRKRTTRQQVLDQAKKQEIALFGPAAYTRYEPPARPIKKAPDVNVRVVHEANPRHNKVDDDDGHYIVVPDAELTEDYQMIKLLGQGTFGKVVQARDRRGNGELVAIKIIRSVQKYRDASRIELRVLQTLRLNDPENRNRCIHLRDTFDFRGHICIVMDLLGQSVFDFLKSNNFVPFPNSQIQSFARQLFTSVAFLHDLNLIHTDLKPENILLADSSYQTFTYNRKIPSSSTTVNRQAAQRKVLLDTEIRLIDFGSATFQDEYHSSVVSTRHYRAPEIILGLGWSYPCDIWSIGCILVEFFTGDALFQTHDNLEHLAMMEAVCDGKIDTSLVQQMNRTPRNGGNPASKYFKRCRLDYPTLETTRASRRYVKAMKKLQDIIPPTGTFSKQFLDLLKKIFIYDPQRRITAKEALNHPWFKEIAHPDDGTEAARIRADRKRNNEIMAAARLAHPQ